ncbi:hypothetical protein [Alkalihalobacillus sp. CinArs1]|uniref:hypothetical protein n=1 Tax=Alkalihalobacillus sp. CinArs1 TaxID=2995314 RepID=UPI0022DD0119|nr:hypothetical protein [Alkalihalobacillus sp. CinArs1]
MNKAKESRKYVLFVVAFFILITIDRFLIEAKWFDYLYYFFMLSVLALISVIHFKQKKWVYAGIFTILLFWYVYGFQFI